MLCMAGHPLLRTARAPYCRTPKISSKTMCKAVDLNSAYSSNTRTAHQCIAMHLSDPGQWKKYIRRIDSIRKSTHHSIRRPNPGRNNYLKSGFVCCSAFEKILVRPLMQKHAYSHQTGAYKTPVPRILSHQFSFQFAFLLGISAPAG